MIFIVFRHALRRFEFEVVFGLFGVLFSDIALLPKCAAFGFAVSRVAGVVVRRTVYERIYHLNALILLAARHRFQWVFFVAASDAEKRQKDAVLRRF